MDYLKELIQTESFANIANTMITTAEDITFTIIGDDMKVKWVNDFSRIADAKKRTSDIDSTLKIRIFSRLVGVKFTCK